jgi:hypothetical protein
MSQKNAPNIQNYLGRCYDILQMDPFESLSPLATDGGGVLNTDTSNYVASNFTDSNGDDWYAPSGTTITNMAETDGTSDSFSIENSESYKKASKTHVSVSAGVAGVASFSTSLTHSNMFSSKRTSKHYGSYSCYLRRNYVAALNDFPVLQDFAYPTSTSAGEGSVFLGGISGISTGTTPPDPSKYGINQNQTSESLLLSSSFMDDVEALPISFSDQDSGTVNKFKTFISKYGTHFASAIVFGGYAKITTAFSSSMYQQTTSNSTTVSESAKATFDDLSFGESASHSWSSSKSLSSLDSNTSIDFKFVGGSKAFATEYNGSGTSAGPQNTGTFNDWINSVDNNPVPLKLHLVEISELLTSTYFPDTSNISDIQTALQQAVLYYKYQCGIPEMDTSNVTQLYTMNSTDVNDKYKTIYVPVQSGQKVTTSPGVTAAGSSYAYSGWNWNNNGPAIDPTNGGEVFFVFNSDQFTGTKIVRGNDGVYSIPEKPNITYNLKPVYSLKTPDNFYLYSTKPTSGLTFEFKNREGRNIEVPMGYALSNNPSFYMISSNDGVSGAPAAGSNKLAIATQYQYRLKSTNSCYLTPDTNNIPGQNNDFFRVNIYREISPEPRETIASFFKGIVV